MTALICWTLFSVICSNTRKPAGFFCISMKMVWGGIPTSVRQMFWENQIKKKKKKISFSGTLVSAGIGRFMLKLDFFCPGKRRLNLFFFRPVLMMKQTITAPLYLLHEYNLCLVVFFRWFSSHSYVGTRLTVGTQKWLFSHLCPLSLSIGKKQLHTNSTQRLNEWKHKFSTTKANCVFFQERKKRLRCFGNAV